MSTQAHCGDLEVLLSAYVDHEATAEEMTLVEAHARTCSNCAARLRRYQTLTLRLEADVRTLLFKSEVAAGQVRSKRAALRSPPERMRLGAPPVRLVSRLATVALVLAAAMLGVVLLRSAPTVRTPGLETGAPPVGPTAGSTLTPRAPVLVASIDGLVDPAVAAYVHRAVSAAEERRAGALIVVLNASGGLDGPMRQVTQDLASSAVPTLAFVAPGRTNAADSTLAQSSEVVVADATTTSLDAFLRAVDGREARTPAGPVTLATGGARVETFDMELSEALEHRLMDPTTAYLLFVLGLYGVFVEFAHPGSLLPGATGLVCLTLAAVGLRHAAHELARRGGARRRRWAHGARAQGGDPWRARLRRSRGSDRRLCPAVFGARVVVAHASRRHRCAGGPDWRRGHRADRRTARGPGRPTDPQPAAHPQPRAADRRTRGKAAADWIRRASCMLAASSGPRVCAAVASSRASQSASSPDTGWYWKWSRRRSAPPRGKEPCHDPVHHQSRWATHRPRGSGWPLEPVDQNRARIPAHRPVSIGQVHRRAGPGPIWLIPFVDRSVVVDLRELFVEIPHQSCITKDNVPIQIDFLVYRQVIDAVSSVIAVTNFASAAQGIAATTLRSVIGDIVLDDVLAKREQINQDLRIKLDEVTERWGVKVTAVEIREVVPAKDVQDAMNRQMSAERTRRAAVTEAEGKRQATITVAEGDKQSQICAPKVNARARFSKPRATARPCRPCSLPPSSSTPRR